MACRPAYRLACSGNLNLNPNLDLDIWHTHSVWPLTPLAGVSRSGQRYFFFRKYLVLQTCFFWHRMAFQDGNGTEKSISFLHHSHRKPRLSTRRQLSARISKGPGSRRTRRALCDCGTWFCRNITLGHFVWVIHYSSLLCRGPSFPYYVSRVLAGQTFELAPFSPDAECKLQRGVRKLGPFKTW
jgi:hypothetical protein